jgi:hypothetical protein
MTSLGFFGLSLPCRSPLVTKLPEEEGSLTIDRILLPSSLVQELESLPWLASVEGLQILSGTQEGLDPRLESKPSLVVPQELEPGCLPGESEGSSEPPLDPL